MPRPSSREEMYERILVYLKTGPKETEEIRRHIVETYPVVYKRLQDMRLAGLIQSGRSKSSKLGLRWRLTPDKKMPPATP